MATPSQPDVCSNTLTVRTTHLSSSPLLNKLSDTIAQSQGEMAQANCSYTNTRPLMAKSKRIDDPANVATVQPVFTIKPLTNSQQLAKFRETWGRNAVASGQISPAYFDTYKSILSIPLLPDNVSKEEYDEYVNRLAYMIKAWYVAARYAGNLAELALAIDRDKPVWVKTPATASEGFCGSMFDWSAKMELNETAMFTLIVGLGLVGICFWKACK